MDAAALVQLAQARGIDLKFVAGVASNTDGVARRRQRTEDEVKLGIPAVRETVNGRPSRTYRPPTWTVAELGQAAKGLGPVPWAAALYSFAGARDGYWILWHALATEAQRLAKRENWPPCVRRGNIRWIGMLDSIDGNLGRPQHYREDLAALVLTEDAHRHFFVAAPQLYAVCMEVTSTVWEHQLRDPFRSLKGSYERWLGTARSAIGRWMSEPA